MVSHEVESSQLGFGCGHCVKILFTLGFLNTEYGSLAVRFVAWKIASPCTSKSSCGILMGHPSSCLFSETCFRLKNVRVVFVFSVLVFLFVLNCLNETMSVFLQLCVHM